jgi:integrase
MDPLSGLRAAFRYVTQQNRSLLAHLSKAQNRQPPLQAFVGSFGSSSQAQSTYRFPAKYVWPLLFLGFSSSAGETDETAQLLSLMLFAGGLRSSEHFHLWVQDVQFVGGDVAVFLHHPADGIVYDVTGKSLTRAAYLNKKPHAFREPRNRRRKRGHAGFKGTSGEAEIIWLPLDDLKRELAQRMSHYLTVTRPRLMRLRRERGYPDHSFLFVSSGHLFGENTNAIGSPYTMEAFKGAWRRAIARTSSLKGDPELTVSKRKGTTPHGARHFYGTFLKTIGVSGEVIMRCMRHKSPYTHLRYTELTPQEINEIISRRMKEGQVARHLSVMASSVSEALKRQASGGRFAQSGR